MIISSLLDTDLYKFTMMQVVWQRLSNVSVEYAFKCRASGVNLSEFAQEIREELDFLSTLTLNNEELSYLKSIRYISPEFVESLRGFRLDPSTIEITTEPEFSLRIRGSWLATILFEVPVLAIINEVYFRNTHPTTPELIAEGRKRLHEKASQIGSLRIMEFGTRRRYSQKWQEEVVNTLKDKLIGTSNVYLAKKFNLKPFGTMAHEFLQAGQALVHPLDSQKFMLEAWMQSYRGDLGIALSDIFGFEKFLEDFDLLFTKAYDGCRHDSGDPVVWGEKLLAHYEKQGVDARSKTAVFSDGLDIPKALALSERFEGRIRTIFGIGTNLTNDLGAASLPVVLKLVSVNGRPVIKLSDSPGKTMSEDAAYETYLRHGLQQSSRSTENGCEGSCRKPTP
jgi:nicotinate phosphoribosyltransferase